MKKRSVQLGWLGRIALLGVLLMLCAWPNLAAKASARYTLSGKNYDIPEDGDYSYAGLSERTKFFYGQNLGGVILSGSLSAEDSYNGCAAYGATYDVTIEYPYKGEYHSDNKDIWNLTTDGTGELWGYDLGLFANMGYGCIIVEKSDNGARWELAVDPMKDYFKKERRGQDAVLYKIPESEYKNGMYYRVSVAYKFARRTESKFLSNKYTYKKCVEVYQFFLASQKDYVTFRDMGNDAVLKNQASTDMGFMLCRNGSTADILVNGNKSTDPYDCFTEPGEYEIKVTTKLKQTFSYSITVKSGTDLTPLSPSVYVSEKDKGFPTTGKASSTTPFNTPLTSLSIATEKGAGVKRNGAKYGIKGKSVGLYLELNRAGDTLGSGWALTYDKWGKKSKQTVGEVMTGEVGKGALIIQTSTDGKNWTNVEKGRYAKGLYTTDYATHYGRAQKVLIYTPAGKDVIKGLHIRVLFAYQINNPKAKEKKTRDIVERYQFYLCSDALDAVTIHNLTLEDTFDEKFSDVDLNTIEVYRQAESLESGSYTVSGFKIDTTLNPTVKVAVRHNGNSMGRTDRYIVTGRYDITLTSAVGSTKEMTIYVDRNKPEDAMRQYFDEGFLSGKRIFSEGNYPVYEAGECGYALAAQDENALALCGKIENLTTGAVIDIAQSPEEKAGVLEEPGEYQAVFATSEKAFAGGLAGDARVFTFRFSVIAQGTAPGPVVNQRLLAEYSHTTVSDCRPVYYSLTYSSAGAGNITLAFATREDAFQYAYNYEKGTVEPQANGGYRYTGSFIVEKKTEYNSAWDLTDAFNYFAEAAVHEDYFDLSDEYTYCSLRSEVLEATANLRQLELGRSVTIFADHQREKLTDIDALPLLNDKPYAYLNPDTGETDVGVSSFEFVTDAYGGIDSSRVVITDSAGARHDIAYFESVGAQLEAAHCPSGIVTVREETVYGDAVEYQAVYIAPGENQTELTLALEQGGDSKTVVYRSADKAPAKAPAHVAEAFSIADVCDPLDPCALVIVSHGQRVEAFAAQEGVGSRWTEPGEYQIRCVNRLGYGYSVTLRVENDGAPAAFAAEAGEDAPAAQVSRGLPHTADEAPEETEIFSNWKVIAIAAAGAVLLLLLALAIRRIRLFTRATESVKGKEDDKHA